MPILQKYKLVLTVFISVLIHLLLFALLYATRQTKTIVPPESELSPISARLYYYTPPVQPEIAEKPPEKLNETLPEEVVLEKTPEVAEQEITEPESVEETPQVEELTDQTVVAPTVAPSRAAQQVSESAINKQYSQPVQDLVQGQLYNYQQEKLDKLAAQAAVEYRKQLSSPTLLPTPQESFVTEEERYMQKVTTSVDCSSATNQTLAIVMGIMGGAVRCSEPPPFDSFIQKRLNKTAELPALQQ